MKFGTLAVHAGVEPDPTTGAIMTPIYQSSTFVHESPGVHKGYEYARTGNPTRTALEKALAKLEGADFGLCFGSGMAATTTILQMLNPGDEVVSTNDLYGGTYRAFTQVFQRFGIKFTFVNMMDVAQVAQALTPQTKLVWIETPSNPMLNVVDIAAVAQLANDNGAQAVVDNTFASPYLQNPLSLGASIVLHSVTKYLGGHSDTIMGATITNDSGLYEQMKFLQNTCGAVPGPNDCFLVLRGIKTLEVRMKQHCINARQVAAFLNEHPKIGTVLYPGLPNHPNHEVAKRQMRDFGGMISFTSKGDTIDEARKIMESTKLFTLAESLGGVESLIGHPATMTHAAIPREERYKAGLTDSFIRLSVGIEDADDLIGDLSQALEKI
jgi:cystathionine gamma-lyase